MEFTDVKQDQGGEEKPGKGLQVVVNNPQLIYEVLPTVDWEEDLHCKIQDEEIGDSLFSSLETVIERDIPTDLQYPNAYSFASELKIDGKNVSINKFTGGYLSDEEKARLKAILEAEGYTGINEGDDPGHMSITFSQGENTYGLDMGFADAASKQAWINEKIEHEKIEMKSLKYFTKNKERLMQRNNSNMRIRSKVHDYENRSPHSDQNFAEDIGKYEGL